MPKQAPSFVCKSPKPFPAIWGRKYELNPTLCYLKPLPITYPVLCLQVLIKDSLPDLIIGCNVLFVTWDEKMLPLSRFSSLLSLVVFAAKCLYQAKCITILQVSRFFPVIGGKEVESGMSQKWLWKQVLDKFYLIHKSILFLFLKEQV